MDASPPLPIPRLRLPRLSPPYKDQALTPVAGPSHNPDLLSADDDNDEDAESTPRMSASATLDRESPRATPTPGLAADNPTARLRALLARVPNSPNNATPTTSSRPLTLLATSEPDSDFEPPQSIVTTSSFARESLKELFSHALRDTPRKHGRPRRNSIDTSEVDASPRVEKERERHKAQRRSLSDEEAEKSSRSIEPSEASFRSSAASAFDALRQRLDRSTSVMPSVPQERMVMDMSMPPLNSSTDTAMPQVIQINSSTDTPPRATSTPMRTFQMSAHLDMHSNLLEQDSEMQNALQDMESYESAPFPRHRHHSTPALKDSPGPTPRPQPHGISPRPMSWSSHSKSHSVHKLPPPPAHVHRKSEDLDSSSSRASSSLSGADYKERQHEGGREQLHDRERGWNSPIPRLPKSPAHSAKNDANHRHSWGSWGSPQSGRGSPAHQLVRKGSAASLSSIASTDDGLPSSRASSVVSQSEYKERVKEFQEERKIQREREWNRPQPKLSRSSSSLSLNKSERVRAISTPSRPDSAASYLSPTALHRRDSVTSLASSRPSSPTSSVSSKDIEEEVVHEIVHIRERNWNSPRPDWHMHRRSLSPLPRSRPGSPTGSPVQAQTLAPRSRTNSTTTPRSRTNSMTSPRSRTNSSIHGNSLSVPSPVAHTKTPVGQRMPQPKTPSRSPAEKLSPHGRSKSPVPPTPPPENAESSQPSYRSRFGWSFPRQKAALPPLELDQESPHKPLSRPSSRTSLSAGASTASHIPVRSPRKGDHGSSTSMSMPSLPEKKRLHRRTATEFTESIGAVPPRIEVSVIDDLPSVPVVNGQDGQNGHDGHDDYSSASEDESNIATSTPTVKLQALPLPEVTTTPVSEPPAINGHASHEQEVLQRPESPLASPPLTPPSAEPQPMLFDLQTPPRRPAFHTPKTEFETPPPPRGMPDLPGPPSSEDEDQGDHTPLMKGREIVQGDLTAMKTPRPPGAWMATPAPTRQSIKDPVERPKSAPPTGYDTSTSSDSGLATPPSTLSRASTLPPQTPAPPGGWVATPAPSTSARRRGSLLKVRFDLEADTTSESVVDKSSADGSSEAKPAVDEPQTVESSPPNASLNGDASAASSAPTAESSIESPPTPPSLRERIRQKSPSIRVLDAYGREQIETEAPPAPKAETPVFTPPPKVPIPLTSSPPRKTQLPTPNGTPRSRSAVRVVDAMGREIEEEPTVEEDSSLLNLSQTPLSHNEALSRMRDTLSSMKHELSDADRSTESDSFDERMYALQEQCKAAERARSKLSKSLQVAQSAEGQLKSKRSAFRNMFGNGTVLQIGNGDVQVARSLFTWRSIVGFILVQLLLLIIMYRYSFAQARKIFLTTYYDAFTPELYLYLLKPDTTNHTIPTCPSWSIFTIFGSLQRAGLKGVITDAWASASCAVSSYVQSTWAGWHYAQDTVTYAWPPT